MISLFISRWLIAWSRLVTCNSTGLDMATAAGVGTSLTAKEVEALEEGTWLEGADTITVGMAALLTAREGATVEAGGAVVVGGLEWETEEEALS